MREKRGSDNVKSFIEGWLQKPEKSRVYGNYYSKVVNGKSFLLNQGVDYHDTEIRLLAVRFLNSDIVLSNLFVNKALPSDIDRDIFSVKDHHIFDFYTLESKFKEDITELEFKEAIKVNGVSNVLISCGSKQYLCEVPAHRMSPIIAGKYREMQEDNVIFGLKDIELRVATGSSIKECRANVYPGIKDTDIIYDFGVYLTPFSGPRIADVPKELLKECAYCPDPLATFGQPTPMETVLNIAPEPLRKETWSYLYNRSLCSIYLTRGEIGRNNYSNNPNNKATVAGSNKEGDIICMFGGGIYKYMPLEGFVKVFKPPIGLFTSSLGSFRFTSDLSRAIESPYHPGFYITFSD